MRAAAGDEYSTADGSAPTARSASERTDMDKISVLPAGGYLLIASNCPTADNAAKP
jgi:hypothetical protein